MIKLCSVSIVGCARQSAAVSAFWANKASLRECAMASSRSKKIPDVAEQKNALEAKIADMIAKYS